MVAEEASELKREDIEAFVANLSPDQRDEMVLAVRGEMARRWFTPEGFAHFFWCIYGLEIPAHGLKWVEEIFEAYREGTGQLMEAFRGSTKSTVMGAFALFVQGHRPEGSTLIVAASDEAANRMSALMAVTIESSRGWKVCFPFVVPDKERGWGERGYFVKDIRVEEYGEWVQRCISDHQRDPSFVGSGVTGSGIVGMHPSNCLVLDDILDEKNTASEKEGDRVKKTLTANIYPIMSRPGAKPFIGVAFTSWTLNDAYQVMKSWGILRYMRTPVYVVDAESPDTYKGVHVRYAWPEVYSEAKVREMEVMSGLDFFRMFLCDMTMLQGVNLKVEWLHDFPQESISTTWPVYFGIDFASTPVMNTKRDFFALAVGRAVPSGGVVVVDGINERMSTPEAVERTVSWASRYGALLRRVGVEKWGKGEEFLNLLIRETQLPVVGLPIKGRGGRSKQERFEREMASAFQFGRAWLGSVSTPFLQVFRMEWAAWPDTGVHDDALDAVYWLLEAAMGHVLMKSSPLTDTEREELAGKPNPYRSFSRLKVR